VRCIQSIPTVPGVDWTVAVVDNCSTDGTQEWLRRNRIAHDVPRGRCSVAMALNRGFHRLRPTCEWLLVLNNDVTLTAAYVEALLSFAQAHERAAWVVGHAPVAELPSAEPVRFEEMASGDASATLYRTSALTEVGGWDERFWPRYGEDEDLMSRLLAAGWECWRLPVRYGGEMGGYLADNPGVEAQGETYRRAMATYRQIWGALPRSAARYVAQYPDIGRVEECTGGRSAGPAYLRGAETAAIVCTGHIGDMMLAEPMARELRECGYRVSWYAVEPYLRIIPALGPYEAIDAGALPQVAADGRTPFERAAGPAVEDAWRRFDRVVIPQVSYWQAEYLTSRRPFLDFMWASVGGFEEKSRRPRLVSPTGAVRQTLAGLIEQNGRASVLLNFSCHSAAARIDWRYWSDFAAAVQASGAASVYYSEPPGLEDYRWRGDTEVRIIGKLPIEVVPYIARRFDLVVTTSSAPWVSAYAHSVPCVCLLSRASLGGFAPNELLRQYALASQGVAREWECTDVVLNRLGIPERYTAAELADMCLENLAGRYDLRAATIDHYCDLFKGYEQ